MSDNDNQTEGVSHWLKALQRLEPASLEILRGWSLTFLYFALALWSLVFVMATINFWGYLTEEQNNSAVIPLFLILTSLATSIASMRSGGLFLTAMRAKLSVPKVDVVPFFLIVVTILMATRAFAPA